MTQKFADKRLEQQEIDICQHKRQHKLTSHLLNLGQFFLIIFPKNNSKFSCILKIIPNIVLFHPISAWSARVVDVAMKPRLESVALIVHEQNVQNRYWQLRFPFENRYWKLRFT